MEYSSSWEKDLTYMQGPLLLIVYASLLKWWAVIENWCLVHGEIVHLFHSVSRRHSGAHITTATYFISHVNVIDARDYNVETTKHESVELHAHAVPRNVVGENIHENNT
jgi:hypothetical protein